MSDKKPDAWHPGIKSTLPSEYLPLSTLFRPENVFSTIETAHELADFTGLPVQQLVVFRPQRLIVHELLIRVSADIFVSDGNRYEDLGINFRAVVERILSLYIEPEMPALCEQYAELAQRIETAVDGKLATSLFAPANAARRDPGFSLARLFGGGKKRKPTPVESPQQRDQRLLCQWEDEMNSVDDRFDAALMRGLVEATRFSSSTGA